MDSEFKNHFSFNPTELCLNTNHVSETFFKYIFRKP